MNECVNEHKSAPYNHPTGANAGTENRTCSNLVHEFVHVLFRSTKIILAIMCVNVLYNQQGYSTNRMAGP